jgi:septal ring factor EnvC (AmiA/AmiB activator)
VTDGSISLTEKGSEAIGLLAQDVYEIIPEVVSKPLNEESDLWSISYDKLVPVLIKAIQEQQQQIELQNRQIELQRLENTELRQELNSLKTEMECLKALIVNRNK